MTGQRPPNSFDDPRHPQDESYSDGHEQGVNRRVQPQIGHDQHSEHADPYAPYAPHQLDGLPDADAPYPADLRGGDHYRQQEEYPEHYYADDGYDQGYEEPRRSRTPGLAMVGAVFGLVLVVGAGVAGYRYLASDSLVASGEPPLIKAETTPIKVTAEAPAAAEDSPQNKLIYGRIEGGNPANANVVASSEEPVERPPAAPRDVSRVILPNGQQQPADSTNEQSEDDMRRIRTVVIKPETVPGGAGETGPNSPERIAPVLDESIKQPATDGPSQGMALLGDNAVGIMVGGDDDDAPASAPTTANQEGGVPVEPVAVPLPQARPPANMLAAAQQSAPPQAPSPQQNQQVSAVAAPTVPVTAASSGFYVQLASHKSEGEARSTYASLQRRYGQVLGQYQPVVQPANLGERGIYYRLRVGPFSARNDAITVCTALKDAGGTCIVQQ